MKSFFKFFVPLLILGAVFFYFRSTIDPYAVTTWENVQAKFFPPAPCSQPIPYNLGTFDMQFGISKDYFLSALADAEAIWEKPFGKNLFLYSPNDTSPDVLKVNLVYDYRQEADSTLSSLGIVVNNDKASYDSLKAKFTALQTQYTAEKNHFTARVNAFNTEQASLEQQINSWNAKGGAPQDEYAKLQAGQAALASESKDLQITQTNLNGMVDEINALVAALNHLASTLNISVDQYNTVVASRG
jgi:hypothetical protein